MRDAGQADRYRDLRVNYVAHHNPDLLLFDASGEEIRRVDLTRLKTKDNIHRLCQLLGLVDSRPCRDEGEEGKCEGWARAGECETNPEYMATHCRASCKLCEAEAAAEPCVNLREECEYWSGKGARSAHCAVTTESAWPERPRRRDRRAARARPSDLHRISAFLIWQASAQSNLPNMAGECQSNRSFMSESCRRACGLCGAETGRRRGGAKEEL